MLIYSDKTRVPRITETTTMNWKNLDSRNFQRTIRHVYLHGNIGIICSWLLTSNYFTRLRMSWHGQLYWFVFDGEMLKGYFNLFHSVEVTSSALSCPSFPSLFFLYPTHILTELSYPICFLACSIPIIDILKQLW